MTDTTINETTSKAKVRKAVKPVSRNWTKGLARMFDVVTERGWRRVFQWGGCVLTLQAFYVAFVSLPEKGWQTPTEYYYVLLLAMVIMCFLMGLRTAEKLMNTQIANELTARLHAINNSVVSV